ncbi:MAG: hypothetical protein ACK5P5_03915 [Pseudobdellovibrionaceae bacterium]
MIRNSWGLIVSTLYPDALISYVSALTFMPTEKGEVFLTSSTRRDVVFPGLVLRMIRGPRARLDDIDFMSMKASSLERALLENLSLSGGSLASRRLPQEMLEARLEQILLHKGEDELRRVRSRAKKIAMSLDLKKEFFQLDHIIGAMLGTQNERNLKSEKAKSLARGRPYDAVCLGRLELLFGFLRHLPMREREEVSKSPEHYLHKAFFESYFSNYIEGTVFEVKEAEKIVFDKAISNRPLDAHDVFGTFEIVSDLNEMRRTPERFEDLEILLKSRHHKLMELRAETLPGKFKKIQNRAGNTTFVHP